MRTADRLIHDIVAASRIPWGRRRREVDRELRAHVEDFVSAARRNGRGEEEIERLLAERFGDPREIAERFAWVYRRDRAALRVGVFAICTIVVSIFISAAAISMQAGMAFWLGAPIARMLTSRHTAIEALDILATAAAYVGMISLERLYARRPFARALAILTASTAALVGAFTAIGLPPRFLVFGFANSVLLRAIQHGVRNPVARLAAVLAGFAALGALFFHPAASAIAASAVSTLIMGAAYQLMATAAARVDRVLRERFQGL